MRCHQTLSVRTTDCEEETMPIIQVEMKAGRDDERKALLVRKLTEAVVDALDVQPAQVRILLREYAPGHYTVGSEILPSDTGAPPTERP